MSKTIQLVVDTACESAIPSLLTQWESDRTLEGWIVLTRIVWSGTAVDLQAALRALTPSHTFLVGDSIPFLYGLIDPDGHGTRSLSADWQYVLPASSSYVFGAIGRIYFALQSGADVGSMGLYTRYFNKRHTWSTDLAALGNQVTLNDHFTEDAKGYLIDPISSRLPAGRSEWLKIPNGPDDGEMARLATVSKSLYFAMSGGQPFSNPGGLYYFGGGAEWRTYNPRVGILFAYGSFLCETTWADQFLSAAITTGHTLASIYDESGQIDFTVLDTGATIGEMAQASTFNMSGITSVYGDPSLSLALPPGGGPGSIMAITFPVGLLQDDAGAILNAPVVTILSVTDKSGTAIASPGAVVNDSGTANPISVDYDAEAHGEAWIELSVSQAGHTITGANATLSLYCGRDSGRLLTDLDSVLSSRLAASGYTAPDNADIAALVARADPATSLAAVKLVTDHLNTALELSGGNYRLTAASLVLAPTGSGGSQNDAAIQADIQTVLNAIPTGSPLTGSIEALLSTLTARTDPTAALTGIKTVTDHLNTALELSGSNYRLTAASLVLAPTGSGGSQNDAAIQADIQAVLNAIPSGTASAGSVEAVLATLVSNQAAMSAALTAVLTAVSGIPAALLATTVDGTLTLKQILDIQESIATGHYANSPSVSNGPQVTTYYRADGTTVICTDTVTFNGAGQPTARTVAFTSP